MPTPSAKRTAVYLKACNELVPLPQQGMHVHQFQMDVAVDAPGASEITFQANVTHSGNTLSPPYLDVVGVGFTVQFKYAATFDGLASASWQEMPNAVSGFNIRDRNPTHYGAAVIVAAMAVQAGLYRFGVFASAHTDADPRDGIATILAEGSLGQLRGLNCLPE